MASGHEASKGVGAFPDVGASPSGNGDRVVLIRNNENRRRDGEIPVTVPPALRYDEDPSYNGGCTKPVVERNPATSTYRLVDSFNIRGGTDTNCAGGELPFKKRVTCEEVASRGALMELVEPFARRSSGSGSANAAARRSASCARGWWSPVPGPEPVLRLDDRRRPPARRAPGGRRPSLHALRLPVSLTAVFEVADRSAALHEEARIKRLPRAAKLGLIARPGLRR